MCPEISLDIQNEDGSPLKELFVFDYWQKKLFIDTTDVACVGDYQLMLVASFEGDVY